jgi:hypothetical protein
MMRLNLVGSGVARAAARATGDGAVLLLHAAVVAAAVIAVGLRLEAYLFEPTTVFYTQVDLCGLVVVFLLYLNDVLACWRAWRCVRLLQTRAAPFAARLVALRAAGTPSAPAVAEQVAAELRAANGPRAISKANLVLGRIIDALLGRVGGTPHSEEASRRHFPSLSILPVFSALAFWFGLGGTYLGLLDAAAAGDLGTTLGGMAEAIGSSVAGLIASSFALLLLLSLVMYTMALSGATDALARDIALRASEGKRNKLTRRSLVRRLGRTLVDVVAPQVAERVAAGLAGLVQQLDAAMKAGGQRDGHLGKRHLGDLRRILGRKNVSPCRNPRSFQSLFVHRDSARGGGPHLRARCARALPARRSSREDQCTIVSLHEDRTPAPQSASADSTRHLRCAGRGFRVHRAAPA